MDQLDQIDRTFHPKTNQLRQRLITQVVYPKARMLDLQFTFFFPFKKEASSLGSTPSGELCQLRKGSDVVEKKNFITNYKVVVFDFELSFSSVAQLCPTLCDPMNRSMPGLPVHHQLPESTQTHVHRVGDAI